jgi:hypothetical protein
VRALADLVRAVVREAIPTAVEVAYPGWKAIGFRDPQSGYFCGLFPQADDVRLAFEHGAALPDPAGLFDPAGARLKQVRYVTVRSAADARRPELAALLRAAVLHGAV